MTWSRFDDLYDEHEKIADAWESDRATIGMHVMATTACNRWLSDGVIRPRWLAQKLPQPRERARVLAALVQAGLFDLLPAGEQRVLFDTPVRGQEQPNEIVVGPFDEDRYIVHDFLDRHHSSVQVETKRAQDAARKRNGRQQDTEPSPNGIHAESDGTTSGRRAESSHSRAGAPAAGAPASRPVPTQSRPVPPNPPRGGRQRERDLFKEQMHAWATEHFPAAPASKVEALADQMRQIGRVPTVENMRAYAEQHPVWNLDPNELAA